MTYSDEEILRRLRIGEDSAWAFKQVEFSGDRPTSPRRDDWAKEVGAFANASGGRAPNWTRFWSKFAQTRSSRCAHPHRSSRTRRRQTGPAG